MSENEQNKPFVINDRRKFRMDGEPVEPRPEEPVAETAAPEAESTTESTPVANREPIPFPVREGAPATNAAHTVTPVPEPAEEVAAADAEAASEEEAKLPPPTAEEIEQVRAAYEATAERIETMMRSQNLGAEHMPPMDFTQLVQSIYMSAMIQLGAGAQQGQQARVDLLGAKNSIEMLSVIEEKTAGNLAEQEKNLLNSALFELRMGFLEITQLLARQAQSRQTTPPPPGTPSSGGFSGGGGFGGGGFSGGGPKIVR
jgi:hypothetical protein